MSNRLCRKCFEVIPNKTKIDGKIKNLQSRKYCLNCSPWGKHNTKVDIDKPSLKNIPYEEWPESKKKSQILSIAKRGILRKRKLIELAGGKCKICGYTFKGCERVFSFHHRDPSQKIFGLTGNHVRSNTWEIVLEEFAKCDMICMNCHAELEDKISIEKGNIYKKILDTFDYET